jgi:thiol:disulfide interchange protein DsbD
MRAMIDDNLVFAHRMRALTPDHPVMRGTAQNPDVYFQGRETVNRFYDDCPGIVQKAMDKFAALTGSLFGSWLQSPWLVGAISLFFFTMGASMFGAFELAVPSAITSRISHQGGGGFGGAFVLGTIGAVVAGPCSGPVVAGILALIGQTGQILAGTMLMLAFSLGMGMIFLVTGAASGWLPQRGAWMLTVKKSFGIFMWLGAIWYASAHLPAEVTAGLTVAVLLGTAVFAWPHADDGEGVTVERARILYSIVAGTIGVVVLSGNLLAYGFLMPAPIGLGGGGGGGGGAQAEAAGRIAWLTDEAEALARAKAEGKPLIIDFTADWCAACHELEAFTFSDATVADAINAGFVPLRIDCTKNDARVAEIQKHYGVTGLPTVVFARGDRSRIDATIGFYNAKDFLPFVERARSGG